MERTTVERDMQGTISKIEYAITKLEDSQTALISKVADLEKTIHSELAVVARNTTSMSDSLKSIQKTNQELIKVLVNKRGVPVTVMMIIILVFVIREVLGIGGMAKISSSGVEVSSHVQR